MPRLGDHKEEMDRTYTPLESKRRSAMNVRGVQYGFFKVAKEPVSPYICEKCGKEIIGQMLNINGKITHYRQCE